MALWRRVIRWVMAAAALALTSPVAAQPSEPPDHPTIGGVRFASDPQLTTGRWCEVRTSIQPGPEPFSGVLVVSYLQDATQTARVSTPVSITPGRPVEVATPLFLPANVRSVTVALHGDGSNGLLGRSVNEVNLVRWGRSDSLPLPPEAYSGSAAFLAIGNLPTLAATTVDEWKSGRQFNSAEPVLVRLLPAWAGVAWTSYAHADCVVVTGQAISEMDPRSRLALGEYLVRGGRVLIVADRPGDEWTALLSADAGALPVSLSVPTSIATPAFARADGETEDRVSVRPLTLTDRGRRDAWRLAWPLDADGLRGCAAYGPVGLGMACVLGLDPARVPKIPGVVTARPLWISALSSIAAPAALASEDASDNILQRTLLEIADAPPLGAGIYILVGGSMLLLAFLVGPFDYFFLGRIRRRQNSWLTALVWIGLASAVAYAGPLLLRSGDTRVSRLSWVLAVAAPSRDGESLQTFAVRQSLTTVFADFTGRARFSGNEAGTFWRGYSPLYVYDDMSSTFPDLPLRYQPAGVVPPDPFRPMAADSVAASLTPGPVEFRRWTLRAFIDEGRPAMPFVVRVEPDDKTVRIRIANLPEGSRVTAARVATSTRTYDPDITPDGARGIAFTLADDRRQGVPDTGSPWSPRAHAASLQARIDSGRWAVVHLELDGVKPDVFLDVPSSMRHVVRVSLAVPLPDGPESRPTTGWQTGTMVEPRAAGEPGVFASPPTNPESPE